MLPADLYDPARLREGDFVLVNPTGKFVIGGPMGDCGLTGRKIIVDTYGGMARHGGGAFSGKDPTKVDRSAAYAARWVAKNVVAAELADRCEVQVAYAIGVAHPISIMVETFGTERDVTAEQIADAVRKVFDLRPAAILRDLDLRRPIYRQTAAYGHFGRDPACRGRTPTRSTRSAPPSGTPRSPPREERVEQRGRGRRRRQGQRPRRGAAAPRALREQRAQGDDRAETGHAGMVAGYGSALVPAVAVVPLVQTRTLARPLDYLAEPALEVGAVVDAPLGPRTVRGVVVGPAEGGDRVLKSVRDTGLRIPPDLVELALEIAARYASTPARALELVLPPTTAPRRTFWAALAQPGEPRGSRQAAVLTALAAGPLPLPALRAATGAGADVLRRLADARPDRRVGGRSAAGGRRATGRR